MAFPQNFGKLERVDASLVNQRILGIDFGKKGGFCWNSPSFKTLYVKKMPEGVPAIHEQILMCNPDAVFAENVHSMPGQGSVSTSTFMRETGRIEGILYSQQGITPTLINPQDWTKRYTERTSKEFPSKPLWKKHLAEIAHNLFPELEFHDNQADAVLIWNYGAAMAVGLVNKKMPANLKLF